MVVCNNNIHSSSTNSLPINNTAIPTTAGITNACATCSSANSAPVHLIEPHQLDIASDSLTSSARLCNSQNSCESSTSVKVQQTAWPALLWSTLSAIATFITYNYNGSPFELGYMDKSGDVYIKANYI